MSKNLLGPFAPDSYEKIKGYAENYATQLITTLGRGVIKQSAMDEKLIIYFDIESVVELIRRISPDAVYLAGVLGIHENPETGVEELTIGLLGADTNGNILQGHRNGSIMGEEVWPNCKYVSDLATVLP